MYLTRMSTFRRFNSEGLAELALEKASVHDALAICVEIEEEVARTLISRFNWEEDRVERILRTFTRAAIRPQITGAVSGICRDANDDMVIECALKAGAKIVVTGDKDLLSLQQCYDIRILPPRGYVELLQLARFKTPPESRTEAAVGQVPYSTRSSEPSQLHPPHSLLPWCSPPSHSYGSVDL